MLTGGDGDVFFSDVVARTVDFRDRYLGTACSFWKDDLFAVIALVDRVPMETTTSGAEFVPAAGLTLLFSYDK